MSGKYSKDFTQGSLAKQVILFALPLMASYLLQVLFNVADIAVIGQFSGANSLAAVGSTTTLIYTYRGIITGVASGVCVIVGRNFGAKNEKGLRESVHTGAFIMGLLGLITCIFSIATDKAALTMLGTKPEVLNKAFTYAWVFCTSLPAMAIYNYGNAVFAAVGDTKRPLLYLSVSGILNVILNLFFVIVCKLDVLGVALATSISQYVSAIWILITLIKTKDEYGLEVKKIRYVPVRAKMMLAIGIGAAAQNLIFDIANLFVQFGVNSFDAIMVAGDAASTSVTPALFMPIQAIYAACASIMSQNYGAGKKDRVLTAFKYSLLYAVCFGIIGGGIYVFLGRQVLGIVTHDPQVINAGLNRLTVVCLSAFLCFSMDCTIAGCRGLGKTFYPTIYVILGSCVFRILWIFTIFKKFNTILSLYTLYPVSWFLTSIAEIAYFIIVWKKYNREQNIYVEDI